MPYLDEVKRDIQRELKRTRDATYLEAKKELLNSVYPLLLSIVDSVEESFGEIYEEMAADSIVQPDLAERILTTLDLGDQIIAVSGEAQEFNTARVKLAELIEAWKIAVAVTREKVLEAVADEDDLEGEDEDEEDAEEDTKEDASGETGEKA